MTVRVTYNYVGDREILRAGIAHPFGFLHMEARSRSTPDKLFPNRHPVILLV